MHNLVVDQAACAAVVEPSALCTSPMLLCVRGAAVSWIQAFPPHPSSFKSIKSLRSLNSLRSLRGEDGRLSLRGSGSMSA